MTATYPVSIAVAGAVSSAIASGLDRLDAQLLLLHALGKPASGRAWLLAHDLDLVPESANAAFMALVQRRLAGEPVAYLTGRKEFFGIELQVDTRVLVPRPDTESLVEWALQVLDGLAARAASADMGDFGGPVCALDLGTGSGAVALAIKHSRPAVQVRATDISIGALAVAEANAERLQLAVHFSQGSWLQGVNVRYHLIASNPPYIAAGDPHLSDLAHEPQQALASGPDGLDDIRAIINQAPGHLHPGGWLLLEHGYDQAARVRELLRQAGFADIQSRRDLGDIERCSGGRWPEIGDPTGGWTVR